ncbi:hypothetical protein EV193_108245 [Herbihabitans rhizosphaerae]|uniref:Uncharacterized protein n=1 Tax=Herbihabitans rhizosphaerae TaxID=1872711 RepID=A0A4Q7KKS5_9PSEU|nr:hypothetical protein [Herbihabitans rhizosphaerae]RZS34895.1 hypothetical protein EV193_108245 [Herbihabitans rhizosphaerae]
MRAHHELHIDHTFDDLAIPDWQQARAVRAVAAAASDADDCRLMLEALGLVAEDGIPAQRDGSSR